MAEFLNHNCGRCAAAAQGVCRLYQKEVSPTDVCPSFTKEITPCAICGTPILDVPFLKSDGINYREVCHECALTSCKSCANIEICGFQLNRSVNLPQTVVKTIRNGNQVFQTQIPNPERIEKTCTHCTCYDKAFDDSGLPCRKQNNIPCDSYKPRYQNVS